MTTFVIVTAVGLALTWLAYLWLVGPLREAQEHVLDLAASERASRVRTLRPRASA
jgi:hypothetical protein